MDSAPYRALQAPVGDEWIDSIGYLSELCHSISQSRLRHRQIELTFVAGSPLKPPVGQCWRLGKIVSEFIANVAMDGAPRRVSSWRAFTMKAGLGRFEVTACMRMRQ
jgi:hypothetical protein